jgi:hypothetical protein
MEVIPGGQPDVAGRKLSFDTLDSARFLGENLRKEQTVVRVGHDVGRGTPHTAGVRLCKCEGYITLGVRLCKCEGYMTLGVRLCKCEGYMTLGVRLCKCECYVTLGVRLCKCEGYMTLRVRLCNCESYMTLGVRLCKCEGYMTLDGKRTAKTRGRSDVKFLCV